MYIIFFFIYFIKWVIIYHIVWSINPDKNQVTLGKNQVNCLSKNQVNWFGKNQVNACLGKKQVYCLGKIKQKIIENKKRYPLLCRSLN